MAQIPPPYEQQDEYYCPPEFQQALPVGAWNPAAATPDVDSVQRATTTPPEPEKPRPSASVTRPASAGRVGLGIGHASRSPPGYNSVSSQSRDASPDSKYGSPIQHVDASSGIAGQTQQYVFTIPETPIHYPPQREGSPDGPETARSRRWLGRGWFRSPAPMYTMFCLGIVFAGAHHAFYSHLDGRPADDQIRMMRIGGLLSYAAKASLLSSVVFAYRQQVWVTARRKRLRLRTIDSLFAAIDEFVALLNWEFAKKAKVAMGLALLTWLFPLTVILTPASLTVAPRTERRVDRCNDVRTLNFEAERFKNWRNPDFINGYPGLSLSVWNCTMAASSTTFTPYNETFFDYWAQSSPQLEFVATHTALSGDVVPRPNVAVETCGAGWNCTYTISFVAPGYKCSEVARGRDLDDEKLRTERGVPFNASILIPNGDYGYVGFAGEGDYALQQVEAGEAGVPNMPPPYPKHLGAFRTEPVLWIGHSIQTTPGTPPANRSVPGWDTAFEPSIFRCEHYLTDYTVEFDHTFSTQTTKVLRREYLYPVINTTYLPGVDANDGTNDNTTAVPESNYVLPLDFERYRLIGAYHALGFRLRTYLHGAVRYAPYPVIESHVTKTLLIDRKTYLPVPNLMEEIQRFYENITLSILSNPQFVIVSWAARPNEPSGVGSSSGSSNATAAEALSYPCVRTRIANTYVYIQRDMWIAYAVAITAAMVCVALGTAALAQNDYYARDTHVSSIVAATRAPCLEDLPWAPSKRGEVPREILETRMGYGIVSGGRDPDSPEQGGGTENDGPADAGGTSSNGGGNSSGTVYYGFAQQEVLERRRTASFGPGKPRSRLDAFSFKAWEQ